MSLLRLLVRDVSRAGFEIIFVLLLTSALTPVLQAQQPKTAVIFYGQPKVDDALWSDLLGSLHADLAAGIGEAPNGFALDQNPTYLRGDDLGGEVDYSQVIVVKLLGRCDELPQLDRSSGKGALGWVKLVSGKIQPFIFVDCARIAEALRRTSLGLTQYERRHEMAQAIAHVVIHEWIHIATQSSSHGKRGITKQSLSPEELIAEPRNNNVATAIH
jgi:hypothetical protein